MLRIILLCLIVVTAASGDSLHVSAKSDTAGTLLLRSLGIVAADDSTQARLDSICAERGHITGGYGVVTLLAPIPRIIDEEDRTIHIYHDPNTYSYTCLRCGRHIYEPVMAHPETTIVWKRNPTEEE